MTERPDSLRLERRRLADLLPHPRQSDYFADIPQHDLEELAQALRKGTVPPIEVIADENKAGLPPGTLLDGHQRKRGHLHNNETEAWVLVRYDLAEASPEEVEQAFLQPNQNRRHSPPLTRARVALRLFVLEKGPLWRHNPLAVAEARHRVGRELGELSGRNRQRYWNVLHTPTEVQDAVAAGRLRLIDADRVSRLRTEEQTGIARRIREGEDPQSVVDAGLASSASGGRSRRGKDPVVGLLRTLRACLVHIGQVRQDFRSDRLEGCLPLLARGRDELAALAALLGSETEQQEGDGAGADTVSGTAMARFVETGSALPA